MVRDFLNVKALNAKKAHDPVFFYRSTRNQALTLVLRCTSIHKKMCDMPTSCHRKLMYHLFQMFMGKCQENKNI